MIGGSSRIPRLQEMVEDEWAEHGGLKINVMMNADTAVSEGACVLAQYIKDLQLDALNPTATQKYCHAKMRFQKPYPKNVGVRIGPNKLSIIVDKGSECPKSFNKELQFPASKNRANFEIWESQDTQI